MAAVDTPYHGDRAFCAKNSDCTTDGTADGVCTPDQAKAGPGRRGAARAPAPPAACAATIAPPTSPPSPPGTTSSRATSSGPATWHPPAISSIRLRSSSPSRGPPRRPVPAAGRERRRRRPRREEHRGRSGCASTSRASRWGGILGTRDPRDQPAVRPRCDGLGGRNPGRHLHERSGVPGGRRDALRRPHPRLHLRQGRTRRSRATTR